MSVGVLSSRRSTWLKMWARERSARDMGSGVGGLVGE